MKDKHEITIIETEFRKGIEKYAEKVKLEFYNCAVFIVDRYWSIAFALRTFLLTSVTKFYGKGSFDLDKLKKWVVYVSY